MLRTLWIVLLLAAAPAAAQNPYIAVVTRGLPGLYHGSLDAADYDRDGDADLLLTGSSGSRLYTAVYRFVGEDVTIHPITGTPVFTAIYEIGSADLDPVWLGDARWGDYDGDGDVDVVVSGSRTQEAPYAGVTRLYTNNNGAFISNAAVNRSLPALYHSTLAWGDYDGDGDLDLALAGNDGQAPATFLYRNDGDTFTEHEAGFAGVEHGSFDWGDYDGDGDLDALVSGMSAAGPLTRVYRNDGGVFTPQAEMLGVFDGSARWGDYDRDGDLDALVAGGVYGPNLVQGVTRIYRNDGGAFVDIEAGLRGVVGGEVHWGDHDGDGDLDVYTVGPSEAVDDSIFRTHIYVNEGGAFAQVARFGGTVFGQPLLFDYDRSGRLDLLMIGLQNDVPTVALFKR